MDWYLIWLNWHGDVATLRLLEFYHAYLCVGWVILMVDFGVWSRRVFLGAWCSGDKIICQIVLRF